LEGYTSLQLKNKEERNETKRNNTSRSMDTILHDSRCTIIYMGGIQCDAE